MSSAQSALDASSSNSPAVDVKQNAMPAKHDEATVPATPASGKERRMPMVVEENKRCCAECSPCSRSLRSAHRAPNTHVGADPALLLILGRSGFERTLTVALLTHSFHSWLLDRAIRPQGRIKYGTRIQFDKHNKDIAYDLLRTSISDPAPSHIPTSSKASPPTTAWFLERSTGC